MTTSGSKDYFDQVATEWDSMRSEFFSEDVRESAILRAGVKSGRLAGDIGAGSGFTTAGLVREGLRVIAVDQSEQMLAQMQRQFGSEGAVESRLEDSESLPIEDGALDYAFANMYLHHVESPAKAIREMARAVAPGGMVVITDLDEHGYEFLRTEQHDRWLGFQRDDVHRWFEEAGLSEVQVEGIGSSCCAQSMCGCGSATVSIFIASGRTV